MLVEFSLSNFRSFRERQTLSMVAAPRLRKKECLLRPELDGERFPDLLKVAAIYGPNASGKSSLMMGMDVVQTMVNLKPNSDKRVLPVAPFRFDTLLADEPSRFEVHFITEKCRYQFELALTKERILEERLIAYPKGVETLYYDRSYKDGADIYKFGPRFEGGETVHNAWKMLTGPQVLFLTQAVANSSEELKQLRIPLKWLQRDFSVLEDSQMESWTQVVQMIGVNLPAIGSGISKYLNELDVPVTEITFKNEAPDDNVTVQDESLTEKQRGFIESVRRPKKTTLTHTTLLGSAHFDLSEESKGTRNLIGFFAPWSILGQHVVMVDEFDSSLHPEIVVALVKKFLRTDGQGQLIFTTHDTHLMDSRLLRRDQFWLTERNASGATRLRSIYDFAGRESEDVEKRYFEGHYRALPIIRSTEEKSEKHGDTLSK